MKRSAAALAALLIAGCSGVVVKEPNRSYTVPEVTNTLLRLIEAQDQEVSSADYSSTSLRFIAELGTPAGLRLKLRYQELGVALVETLKLSRDKQLLTRMLELAQFSRSRRIRSEALVTMASFSDPADLPRFQLAISDDDVGIRFAAVEALQKWGRPGALELLKAGPLRDQWSPLLQIYAAQAVISLGDRSALPVLFEALDDRSWIVRAMAARYIGDHGQAEDLPPLLTALNQETRNDFAAAELSIAALKLLARQAPKPGTGRGGRTGAPGTDRYTVGPDDVVEMDALVLKPPRLVIPENVRVAQAINNRLLQLMRSRLDVPISKALLQDPNMQNLFSMVTPEGFALQTRYSELSIAVAEGLAGTTDPLLRAELTTVAENSRNPVARATALVSLAFGRDDIDLPLVTNAMNDSDPIVRFAGMEAAQVGRFRTMVPQLLGIANNDSIPAFRVYAIQVLLSFGDASAPDLLQEALYLEDWPARAMAYWYLGRYGESSDQGLAIRDISQESNLFVLAEAALAAQRLQAL